MTKIDLINEAFEKAERLGSKLTEATFDIGGFTSPKIRHLLNNLGAISTNYLEIGVHLGSTFESTIFRNQHLETATAIDSFVEFDPDNKVKPAFIENINRFRDDNPSWILLAQDCWTVDPSFFKPIDLYMFDGEHSVNSQEKAVTYFLPAMAQEFIMIIDDHDWPFVSEGTKRGLAASGVTVVEQWIKTAEEGYHNGIGVFLLRKP